MNRMVDNYLRCYNSHHKNDWENLLPSAEFVYHFSLSEELGMSPFKLYFGWKPKTILDTISGPETKMHLVNELKHQIRNSLEDAQHSFEVSKEIQETEAKFGYKAS